MGTLEQREPRNQIRIALRRDLNLLLQRYQGRKCHVIKDPITLRYYRFNEREHFLLQLLDGQHTLEQIQTKFEAHFRPARLRTEEIELFVQQVVTAGLAQNPSASTSRRLLQRRQEEIHHKRLTALGNVMAIQVPLFDPDRLLARLLPWARWLFAPWCLALCLCGILAALLLVSVHFDTFCGRLPVFHEFFRFQTVLCVGLVLGLVKTIHELGHGLCCKYFGGEVHEMGLMLLGFSPCMYCDVSDAWTLPGKWQRIAISFAGIYVELTIAALATFVWWNTPGQPFISNLSLSLMVVCSVSTVIFNGNPLMRFDGYYILADWLEIPNFAERCRRLLTDGFLKLSLGACVRRGASIARWRRRLMLGYALVSLVYRWLMAFAVLWLVTRFLQAHHVVGIAALFAMLTIGSMVGWPVYRCLRFFKQGGRVPEMQPQRLAYSAAVLTLVLLAFFLVPLPVSRVRQVGLVEVPPEGLTKVFLQVPGSLQKLNARDGQRVAPGDVLAEFRNLDLENQRRDALDLPELRALQMRLTRAHGPQAGAAVFAKSAADPGRADREIELMNRLLGRLELRAPRAGVVLGAPPIDEVGKYWRENFAEPFCAVADPTHLWVRVPLGPADYRLLREDLNAARLHGDDLAVTVLVPGPAGRTHSGKVAQLPESEAREVPLALTQHAGGPVIASPGKSGQAVPRTQQYLVVVALDNLDGAMLPGELAHVVIHCRWRSGAWWLWRFLSSSFN